MSSPKAGHPGYGKPDQPDRVRKECFLVCGCGIWLGMDKVIVYAKFPRRVRISNVQTLYHSCIVFILSKGLYFSTNKCMASCD